MIAASEQHVVIVDSDFVGQHVAPGFSFNSSELIS